MTAEAPAGPPADATTDVVDAHLHVIDPGRFGYRWADDAPHLAVRHLPADVETRYTPRYVAVEAAAVAPDSLAEAEWLSALPDVTAVVAHAPLEEGGALAARLDALLDLPAVRGVRRLLQDEPPGFFADPLVREALRLVARAGLSFDACVRWWQLPALDALLDAADLPVVLDHLGKPPVMQPLEGSDGQAWLAGMRRLAARDQVSVKLSGLPAECTDPARAPRTLGPWLRAAADTFGIDRCLVGSDWPMSHDQAQRLGYDDWIDLVVDELGVSGDERRRLLAGTATAVYRLE